MSKVSRKSNGLPEAGYPAVTLRTFRDVPWNGPFYLRRGFAVVDSAALSPGHVARGL
jgi:hypothetical protein